MSSPLKFFNTFYPDLQAVYHCLIVEPIYLALVNTQVGSKIGGIVVLVKKSLPLINHYVDAT